MKKIFFIYCFAVTSASALCQTKYNHNWPLGYGPSNPALGYGGSLIQFTLASPQVSFFDIKFAYSGDNANISDKNGNLIAYTNGCQIQNHEHTLMENGDDINPGILHQQQCTQVSGYSNDQGALFLPKPGSDSLYFLFHLKMNDDGSVIRQLLYSVIDAHTNSGLGKVTLKNELLHEDTLTGMIAACRHANGRDWWLVVQENYRNLNVPLAAEGKYHLYLFDPFGIHYTGEQQIGKLWTPQNWVGQSCFSPDGRKYAIGNIYNGVNVFDFDRCSGILSNPLHFNFLLDTTYAMGLAFSPNSRFLYVTTGLTILQFDLELPNPETNKQVVAFYDGFSSPFPTTFYQLGLAPDDRIYGSCSNSANIIHVINDPDKLGSDCQVKQHDLQLPTYHAYTIPNFAHYRLYDLPGGPCDTLGIDTPVAVTTPPKREMPMTLAPNPAGDVLTSIW